MITLSEIRQKYPDYNDLSDEQLADKLYSKLYSKHYSDMPKEVFYSKIGFQQKPSSFLNDTANFLQRDIANLGKNLATGYLNLGRNVANTPHRLANLVGYGNEVPNLAPEEFNYAEALSLPKQSESKFLQTIPEFATAIAIPGSTLPGVIAGQAAFGATQNQNPLLGAAQGAGGALAGTLVGKGLEKGYNALRPSRTFRGTLTPEQLANNLEVTRGTQTPLGEVINSPLLKKVHENILPNVIGSGVEPIMQKTAQNVTQRGEELLHGLRGGQAVSENYGIKIKNALRDAADTTEREKNSLFGNVNKLAEQSNVKTNRANLRDEAESILKQIKQDPDLARFTNASDISLLQDIAGLKNKSSEFSLKNTDILRGKIGEHAYEANVKGEKPKVAIYARLKEALEKDIDQAIESSSNQELKDARKEAMDFYKNEYAPFTDKDITKFIKQGGDPDLILNHFLRIGKNDRANLLGKLSKSLSPKEENLIGNAYLAPAYENGKLNPVKLSTLYHKLGKNQRQQIFGVEQNKALKNYTSLVNKNKEAFNLMFNPKTGARLSHFGELAGASVLGLSGLQGLLGTALAGRGATKLLTSPSVREKLVNAMIANKDKRLPKLMALLQKGPTGYFTSTNQ